MKAKTLALFILAVLVVGVLLPQSSPLLAAAPLSDDFDGAIVIGSLPYTVNLDTSEATTAPDDPTDCSNNGSVWFAYTPPADMTLSSDSVGSDYTTVFSVYTGTRGSLIQVPGTCKDGWFSPVTFDADAGETYYFMVSFCCGLGGTGGGNLTFNLQQIQPPANDDFDDATLIASLPFDSSVDMIAASLQSGEPSPSCAWDQLSKTVWYRFTTEDMTSVTMWVNSAPSDTIFTVYEGTDIGGLTQLNCMNYWWGSMLTFTAEPLKTYFMQIGGVQGGQVSVHFDVTPPLPDPWVQYSYYPSPPSKYDVIQFYDESWDPAYIGIRDQYWDFGDGSTAEGCCPSHQYGTDGVYLVELQVTTYDDRQGVFSSPLTVATHDVAITKFTAPQSGSAGQTRQLAVGVNSRIREERVEVVLYKGTPYGYEFVGSLIQTVPVRSSNRTTDFNFSYTFSQDDAALGKVTFKAVANLLEARDALSADNEAVADPTKINTGGEGKHAKSANAESSVEIYLPAIER